MSLAVQEMAGQVRCMENASKAADSDGGTDEDLAVMHVALREVVEACDSKAAQLYALQRI